MFSILADGQHGQYSIAGRCHDATMPAARLHQKEHDSHGAATAQRASSSTELDQLDQSYTVVDSEA